MPPCARARSWSAGATLPDEDGLAAWLKTQPAESVVIDKKTASQGGKKSRTVRRQYSRPYIAHGSIAPSCAMAQWTGDRVHVWTHSQGVYFLRNDLALVLKLPLENITVEHMEGAGCYGHNAADDVALDAVLLAKAGRRPSGSRAMVARRRDVARAIRRGDGDRDRGRSRCARRDRRMAPQRLEQRPRRAAGARQFVGPARRPPKSRSPFRAIISTNPPLANGGGADRNSIPLYDFPSWQIECHRLLTMPIRTSALRTLGAQGNVFAIESFLDELAAEQRRGSGRIPAASSPAMSGHRTWSAPSPSARTGSRPNAPAWSRPGLCPLQERRRLLRRRRRDRRRRGYPRQAADHRGRCRRSHQSRTASSTRSRAARSRPPAGC